MQQANAVRQQNMQETCKYLECLYVFCWHLNSIWEYQALRESLLSMIIMSSVHNSDIVKVYVYVETSLYE